MSSHIPDFRDLLQSREGALGGDSGGSRPGLTLTWRDLSVYAKIQNEKLFQSSSTEYRKLVNNGKLSATMEPPFPHILLCHQVKYLFMNYFI